MEGPINFVMYNHDATKKNVNKNQSIMFEIRKSCRKYIFSPVKREKFYRVWKIFAKGMDM